MFSYVKKGPIVTFKGLSGQRPDYLVTVNKKNINGPLTMSDPDSVLHFVKVPVHVAEKQIGSRVRPAGNRVLQLDLGSLEEVQTVTELLEVR